MANRCGPGSVLIVHQGEMGTGFCSSIPRYFDRYVQYIDRQPTLELTDVGEYDIERLYTVLYGPLEPGEYYNRKDLNGDGVADFYKASEVDGEEQIITVYGRDDKFQKYELSYDDWLEQYGPDDAPDLSELIAEYGEDVVNDLKGKYDELVDFIGNVPEDPVGSIKKMAEIFVEGATGISTDCQKQTTGTETELETWILDCVNIGILVDIGIPGLPGLGGIFKNTTIRDIKEAAEKVGSTFEDFINGNPTCGEKKDQECTPEQILKDLGDWVVRSVEDIFGGSTDPIDIETILGKLGGIFGPILSGIIYDQFKDLINGEIEDVIGIPVIPFAPLQECEDRDLETIETSPGQYECGECKQEGFTPTGPRGECIDPNAVDPFDETQCVEEDYFNENKADCEAAGYVNCAGGENTGGQETTGGIIKGTLDDCNVIQDPQCSDVGTYNSDTGECDCPEGYEFEVETGGTCGDKVDSTVDCSLEENKDLPECQEDTTEPTPCPNDGEVRRGGLDDGYCVKPGQSCQSEPTKYAGDDPNINVGQFNSEGFCVAPDDGSSEGTEGSCPDGREPDYFPEDADQDGSFEYQGELYTYDPCDPLGKENSLTSTPIQDTCGNNAVNYPDCNQCENGESPDAHVDSDCSKPLKETGTNQGDACDLENNEVGVIDANGDCKKVGQACNRQLYGFGAEDNCPTGQGYNTPIGVINSNGDCECSDIEEPPEVDCSEITEDNYLDCKKVKCPENSEKPFADSLDQCVPVGVEPCPTFNGVEGPRDDQGNCYDCTDEANALVCGWFDCGDNVYAPTQDDCPTTNPCDDPVYAAENPQECGYTCDDPNATILQGGLTPGACGPCKEGYVFDGTVERCVQIEQPDPCDDPEYAAANPTECGTTPPLDCSDPEYAAANPEECMPSPPPPPETGGNGGGGGGMMGSFTPFLAGISYTPQAVPEPPAPAQKDYMAELDNIIKRSLFEGMA